ncbi:DUF1236 domain-containing protein [Phreatobacter stygius]|nr:DUF1236 domain-containing protein [Phreatobacter stygius]
MSVLARILALSLVAAIPAITTQPVRAQGASDAAQSYSADERAFLDGYISRTAMPSATIAGDVTVGTQLAGNLSYHAIDGHPRFRGHRYTHVNNNHVIVDGNNRVIAIHRHH